MGANIDSKSAVTLEFNPSENVLQTATAVETHFLRIEARMETGSQIMSKQLLKLQSKFFSTVFTKKKINLKKLFFFNFYKLNFFL